MAGAIRADYSNGDDPATISMPMLVAGTEVMTSSGMASGDAHSAAPRDRNCRNAAARACRGADGCPPRPDRTEAPHKRDTCVTRSRPAAALYGPEARATKVGDKC